MPNLELQRHPIVNERGIPTNEFAQQLKDYAAAAELLANLTGDLSDIDADYVAYTTAEQTKLAGIESGAEVNPDVISQADAEAGTATDERIWTAERVRQAILSIAVRDVPKALVIESPGAAEDITFLCTPIALTISKIQIVLRGTSPSVTWTLRHNSDRSATGTEVVTGGTTSTATTIAQEVTTFNNASIP